jgi:riboflavin synthase
MSASARFGGHIVQGHVDAVGRVVRIEAEASSHLVRVETPAEFLRYVIEKGSIAVDGISLTVAALDESSFTVAIIPHTWSVTTLSLRRPGDRVNLEADVLAKYVERLLEARMTGSNTGTTRGEPRMTGSGSGLTEATLRDSGFA